MTTEARDPRSIVTPEAFEIDPALLGVPLATPRQRLIGLLIDLALVGLLTALLSSVMLFVWGGIALALVRVALKRPARARANAATAATALLMRTSAGCLGVLILVIALGVWTTSQMGDEQRESALEDAIEMGTELAPVELRREIAGLDFDGVESADEALRVLARGARRMADVPLPARRQLLRAAVPDSAPWAAQSDSLIELALIGAPPDTADAGAPDVAALSDADALRALAAATDSGSADDARGRALRDRAARIVAADTLSTLSDQVEELQGDLETERAARADVEQEMAENRSGAAAFVGLLGRVWGEIGSAVGLWTFYFTVLLAKWRGQTVGKRIMGVRVLRLDGQPIGWWSAFERAGGYAAGLATGFLGFAQILWDPNRQCIHDKIVGTVVVVDGAPRVPGDWEGAWRRGTKS